MKPVYLASTIRAAEQPLLEARPGLLMQRAAHGLAAVLLAELAGRRQGGPPSRSRVPSHTPDWSNLTGSDPGVSILTGPDPAWGDGLFEPPRSSRRRGVYGSRVLLAVGSGNNGGDALYAGASLRRRGVAVRAWRTSHRVHEGGWAAFRAAGGREVDAVGAVAALADADLVVDGVLGIGGRAGLSEPVATFARACAEAGVPVVAVDLPSGWAADTPGPDSRPVEPVGTAAGAPSVSTGSPGHLAAGFRAVRTVTFGGLKLCHVLEPAASACGAVDLVDIGLELPEPDLRCWQAVDVARVWPYPDASSDKYSRGVVGVDAGSAGYAGAAVLACLGAVHAGAGMVRYLGEPAVRDAVRQAAPSVVAGDGRVQARVLGSGWGDRPDGAEVLAAALRDGLPLVVDADALRHLPAGPLAPAVLLTPHAGELARMLGIERRQVTGDPLAAVRRAASQWRATVLLKGATQYVCGPDGAVTVAVPGPSWTAQAGSGDVLAGICGTLLAAGLSPATAALAAASAQALTAAAAPGPRPPDALAQLLPRTVAGLARRVAAARSGGR